MSNNLLREDENKKIYARNTRVALKPQVSEGQ
jgi:hypothetical protein